ncbi:MAG: hypothetical protein ACLFPQ_04115 [Candidatus Woesearchaeota archaeon]
MSGEAFSKKQLMMRFVFLYSVSVLNLLLIFLILPELDMHVYLLEVFYIIGLVFLAIVELYGFLRKKEWLFPLFSTIFGLNLVNILFILSANPIILFALFATSMFGLGYSLYKEKKKREIMKRSISRKEEINKEIDDDWDKKPGIIYDE